MRGTVAKRLRKEANERMGGEIQATKYKWEVRKSGTGKEIYEWVCTGGRNLYKTLKRMYYENKRNHNRKSRVY